MNRQRVEDVLRALVHETRVEKVPFLAGSIAYHAFLSLLPLFALLLYVASGLGEGSIEAGLLSLGRAIFTAGTQDVLIREIRSSTRSAELSGLGLVVLLWGTLRIFRGLDTAFSDIYETEARNTVADQFRDGLVMLVVFSVAIIGSVLVYRLVPTDGAFAVLRPVVLGGCLTVTLGPMYYLFPDTDVTVLEIAPGTLFAGISLTVFQAAFQLYVQTGQRTVIGGVVLLLTWLYVSGFVVLLGVVLNAVLSNRSADVNVEPVIGGVDPVEAGSDYTRTELHHALSTLDTQITGETPLTLTVEETAVRLPAPDRVTVETDSDAAGPGSGATTLRVDWYPREEGE